MSASGVNKDAESGSAAVEFLAASVLLLVPIVYLILTFASVQAATYAAESAARETGRIYSRADTESEARTHAQSATLLAFLDHGIDVAPREVLTITCEETPCLTPGAGVHIRVDVDVPLPLLPDFLAGRVATSVRVTADAIATVDRFGG